MADSFVTHADNDTTSDIGRGLDMLRELAAQFDLAHPLVAADLETTGTNPRLDRIVSIAALVVRPDGSAEACITRVNPGVPIPKDATAIHGITDAAVAGAPRFSDLAGRLMPFFVDTYVVGYNVGRFDLEMLGMEFARAGVIAPCGCRVIDPYVIWQRQEPRTLSDALRVFVHEDAAAVHDAARDTIAAVKVLKAQCERYHLPDADTLAAYCERRDATWVDARGKLRWRDGQVTIGFGRNCGRTLRDVIADEPDFIDWMLNADFPEDTKLIVRDARQGRYPAPPTS